MNKMNVIADHYSVVAARAARGGDMRGWEGVRRISNTTKAKLLELLVGEARGKGLPLVFVDAGCGRGGDIMKWEHASGGKERLSVIGIDVAREAVNEASRRSARSVHRFTWLVRSMAEPAALPECSGIALHFCLNYLSGEEFAALASSAGSALPVGGLVTAVFLDADRLDCAPIGVARPCADTPRAYRWEMRPWVDATENELRLGQVEAAFRKVGLALVRSWEGMVSACDPDDTMLGKLARARPANPEAATLAERGIAHCYTVAVFRKMTPT